MTSPFNQAGDNARVGWQSQYTNFNFTTAPEKSPEEMYAEGVANLDGGNAERARELIWKAMTRWQSKGQPVTGKVLFHWLVAMLSGRTARQFSVEEVGQLREYQSSCAGAVGDPWADGVRLIYRLLDSALRPPGSPPSPDFDAALLQKQFDVLGEDQRRRLLRLDLFLSGPRRDKMWQDKLEDAKKRQYCNDRVRRAWRFFWPAPSEVRLPDPQRPVADARWQVWLCVLLFAGLACYVALQLLLRQENLGLLGYVTALAGGIAVTAADLERRFAAERSHRPSEPRAGWGQVRRTTSTSVSRSTSTGTGGMRSRAVSGGTLPMRSAGSTGTKSRGFCGRPGLPLTRSTGTSAMRCARCSGAATGASCRFLRISPPLPVRCPWSAPRDGRRWSSGAGLPPSHCGRTRQGPTNCGSSWRWPGHA